MESVFDTPVAAGDVEQSLGGDIFGQQIMAHDRASARRPRRRLRKVTRPTATTPGKP
jgi:hypothetical protein